MTILRRTLLAYLLIGLVASVLLSACARTSSTYLELGDYKRLIKRSSQRTGIEVYYGPGGYPEECPYRRLEEDSLYFGPQGSNLDDMMARAKSLGADLVIIEGWKFLGDPLMVDNPDSLPVFTQFFPSVFTEPDCRN